MSYFICTYTNWCKEYCDEAFFKRLGDLQGNNKVRLIDNTNPSKFDYYSRVNELAGLHLRGSILYHKYRAASDHQFHYNVANSLEALRDWFLETNLPYMLIIESDVIPPVDLLARLDQSIAKLPDNWGILGALYYQGFHDYSLTGLQQTGHALSGCTVYKREVIERYPFRISAENWAAFPDAWISHDVMSEGKYTIWNDHDIRCDHLHYSGCSRQSKPI
jgi:hypothetical protein